MRGYRECWMGAVGALLLLLAGGQGWSYYIVHTLPDFVSPEVFRPTADGRRPSPDNPPAVVEVEILPLPSGWDPAIAEAAARGVEKWGEVPGASLRISTRLPSPGAPYDPHWLSRLAREDGRNTVEFVTSGWLWGPNTIGMTWLHLDDEGRILEAEIFMNGQDVRWAVFPQEGSFPGLASERLQDVEAIVTHEAGHLVGIGHSQYPWSAMWRGAGFANTQLRRLSTDDHYALRYLYPLTAASLPPASIWLISEYPFADNQCGMTTLTPSYLATYSDHLMKTAPLPDSLTCCLFGAGFRPDPQLDLYADGFALNTMIAPEYIGPNFARGTIINGSILPTGTYDLGVTQTPNATGFLSQALFVNQAGNSLPVAMIEPPTGQAQPGQWLVLDGSGSYDPEDSPLSFRWWVEETPVGVPGILSSTTAEKTSLYLPAPGMYVVRLAVSDGIIDSIAAQAIIRAEYSLRSARGDGPEHKASPFSCSVLSSEKAGPPESISRAASLSAALLTGIPLLLFALGRIRSRSQI